MVQEIYDRPAVQKDIIFPIFEEEILLSNKTFLEL